MKRWVPPIIWAGIILLLTSLPASSVPNVGGGDVVGHFAMYGVLGALSRRAAHPAPGGWPAVAAVAVGIAVFAAIDEWHQGFIPGRAPELSDWIADVIGGLAGAAVMTRFGAAPERTA